MSEKQDKATLIYGRMNGHTRTAVIAEIMAKLHVSEGYAGTLYAAARRAATPAAPAAPAATSTILRVAQATPTNKITRFNRQSCRVIDAAIAAALKDVEAQFGVNINVGGGSFSDTEFSTKLRICLGDTDISKQDWDRYCSRFGLVPEDYGRKFEHRGTTFTVCGIKPKSRNAVLGVNARGTKYKFSPSVIGGEAALPRGRSGWF